MVKDVRATKLMTSIITEKSVKTNLNRRRVKLLFAREKIGTTIFLKGVLPSVALPFINCGKMIVTKRATHQAIAENSAKVATET